MRKLISFIVRIPFSLAAFGAWAASAGFNAKFGMKLGGDDLSLQILWTMLFVSFDVLKAYSGMALREALSGRDIIKLALAVAVLLGGTGFSLLAAFSWRAQAAAEDAAKRQAVIETRKTLVNHIEQNRVRAAKLEARNLTKIVAELTSAKRNDRYRTSSQCVDATIQASVKLCNHIAALEGERSRAAERTYRESKIEADQKALDKLQMPTSTANPMAESLAVVLSTMEIDADPERLGDIIMALITIIAEFVSVAGPMLASNSKAPAKPRRTMFKPRRADREAPATPADGRKLARDEAFSWLTRAHSDERVKWDGDAIIATNKQLAEVWGRPASTVNDWLNGWSQEGLIEKKASARGTRIKITA